MRFKKLFSGILVINLLGINTLPSIANTISPDGRYETFNSNSISIRDVLSEDNIPIKLNGNTLINHIGELYSPTGDATITDNIFSIRYNGKGSSGSFKNSTLKENTTYTVFYNITKNTLVKVSGSNTNSVIKLNLFSPHDDRGRIYINKNEIGLFSKVITTPAKKDCTPYIETLINTTYEIGGEFEIKDIIVVEGDYSYIDLKYFKGMQSSFENQLITQDMVDTGKEQKENLGKYKVQVKSTSKNKVNLNDYHVKSNYSPYLNFNNNVITGNYTGTYYDFQLYVYLEKGVKYVLSSDESFPTNNMQVCRGRTTRWEGDSTVIGRLGSNNALPTIPHTGWYTLHIVNLNQTITNLQIEEGSKSTYEPYKESITSVYLNSPLLKEDSLEYVKGQLVHVKRYNTLIVDGSDDEKWSIYNVDNNVNTYIFSIPQFLETEHANQKYLLADKLIPIDRLYEDTAEKDVEGIDIAGNSAKKDLHIRIEKNKLSANNTEEFKKYLKASPVTFIYKMSTPIYEPVHGDLLQINLYKDTTYINNNSNVPSNMEITIDRAINKAVEAINIAQTTPSIANISLARMWINLMKNSIEKDNLQNELNSIVKIEDLNIDKKVVSSNLDIYIKMKNTISMSLSTNNIIFEDYSGTEDMEQTNALDLYISSSLPYDLTASMEESIKNSDGSNTLETNVLKIKDSSKNDYQSFASIKDKIVLNSNCSPGNNLQHSIDIKLGSNHTFKSDVYKTTIKFEAEQK